MAIGKNHSPAFKFKIAFEALQGKPIVEICQRYEVAASLVHKWRDQLKKNGVQVFGALSSRGEASWQREFDDFAALKTGIKKYIRFYNYQRYHQALEYLTPAEVYFRNVNKLQKQTKKLKNESIAI